MNFEAMMRTILIVVLLLFAAAPGWAEGSVDAAQGQSRTKMTTVPRSKTTATSPAKATKVNPCSEFGAGFVQVEGSDTCVRIGGAMGIEAGTNLRR